MSSSIPLSARPTEESRRVAAEFKKAAKALKLPEGSRVGALLIHGLTGMPNEMKPLAQTLEQSGFTVEVPMLAGHGAGHEELLDTRWTDWLNTVRQSLNKLYQTCDKVIVGGLSMGGLLAVLIAAENAKVAGVIALSPTIRYDGRNASWKQIFLPLCDLHYGFFGRNFFWTEDPPFGLRDERLQKIILKQLESAKNGDKTDYGQFRTYAGSLRELHHLLKVVKKQAPEIKCPVLIMHSKEDSVTGPYNPETLYSWLTGTQDKSIIWLEGCDHVVTLDLKKEEVAFHCTKFALQVTTAQALKAPTPAFAQPSPELDRVTARASGRLRYS